MTYCWIFKAWKEAKPDLLLIHEQPPSTPPPSATSSPSLSPPPPPQKAALTSSAGSRFIADPKPALPCANSLSRTPSSRTSHLSFPIANSKTAPVTVTPCIFLLFVTPIHDQAIHTHDYRYRACQFRLPTTSFEPKPINIVNIGPAFRAIMSRLALTRPFPC